MIPRPFSRWKNLLRTFFREIRVSSKCRLVRWTSFDHTLQQRQRLRLFELEARAVPATFTVTTAQDESDGDFSALDLSLREAIELANDSGGADRIEFNINGGGAAAITINYGSQLPFISDPAAIDGTSQPGYAGDPIIEIVAGSVLGNGLVIDAFAPGSSISGLAISGFGIGVSVNASLASVTANRITDNAAMGLFLGGGGATVSGNTISRNAGSGIEGTSANNTVAGNFIGTDSTGTQNDGNGTQGIAFYTSNATDNTIDSNVISGNNTEGIEITDGSSSNVITNNTIGTDIGGSYAIPNGDGGILLGSLAANNTIDSNLISGNTGNGISVANTGARNTISNNRVGTDRNGEYDIRNSFGVSISGTENIVANNQIAGNFNGNVAIFSSAPDGFNAAGFNTVTDNLIGVNAGATAAIGSEGGAGIRIDKSFENTLANNTISGGVGRQIGVFDAVGPNTISGNFIGVSSAGVNLFAGDHGIDLYVTDGVRIEANVVAGVVGVGIRLDYSTNATISANTIGHFGTAAIGNGSQGLVLADSSGNTIEGNSIAGNVFTEVDLVSNSHDNVLVGNTLGAAAAGLTGGGALNEVVAIVNSNRNRIGGVTVAERNVIGGGALRQIRIVGSDQTDILGNYVGLPADGITSFGLDSIGIDIDDSNSTRIGVGTNGLKGNVISGLGQAGIAIFDATGTEVRANRIGTTADGLKALSNGFGISVFESSSTIIGTDADSPDAAEGNVIAGSRDRNIFLRSTDLGGGTVTQVAGNFIGVAADGNSELSYPDLSFSVELFQGKSVLLGGTSLAERNVIAGANGFGLAQILIDATEGVAVVNNIVGLNAAGDAIVAGEPFAHGIWVLNVAGGAAIKGNIVAGAFAGISVQASDGVIITGNTIGVLAPDGTVLGNEIGIDLVGSANARIGGPTTDPANKNVILGSTVANVRLFDSPGNRIQGNSIGVKADGTAEVTNGSTNSVVLDGGSNNNFVGSDIDGVVDDFEGNLIAGANDSVIGANVAVLGSSTFTTIVGNLIGVDATGTKDITGAFYGIYSTEDASGTIIGNEAGKGRPNVVSGHNTGIRLFGGLNELYGNRVGTNAAGTAAIPNGVGVVIDSDTNIVGSLAAGEPNVISGNTDSNLTVFGSSFIVEGNRIGSDLAGENALDAAFGLSVTGQSFNVTANHIVSNIVGGVLLSLSDVTSFTVEDNRIGVTLAGDAALGYSHNTVGVLRALSGDFNVNVVLGVTSFHLINSVTIKGNKFGTDATGAFGLGPGFVSIAFSQYFNFGAPDIGNVVDGGYFIVQNVDNAIFEHNLFGTAQNLTSHAFQGVEFSGRTTGTIFQNNVVVEAQGFGITLNGNLNTSLWNWYPFDGDAIRYGPYLTATPSPQLDLVGPATYVEGLAGTKALHLERGAEPAYAVGTGDVGARNLPIAGTVELWLKLDALPAVGEEYLILSEGTPGDSNHEWVFLTGPDGELRFGFRYRSAGNDPEFLSSSLGNVSDPGTLDYFRQFRHIALTAGSDELRFYIDGLLFETLVQFAVADHFNPSDIPTYIGGAPGAALTLHGTIDEIGFSGHALPESKIRALYDARGRTKLVGERHEILIDGNRIGNGLDGVARPNFGGIHILNVCVHTLAGSSEGRAVFIRSA